MRWSPEIMPNGWAVFREGDRRAERYWRGGHLVRWPFENMPNGWAALREDDRVHRHYYVDGRKADRS